MSSITCIEKMFMRKSVCNFVHAFFYNSQQGSRNGRKANALQVMDNPIQFTLCFQLNDAHQWHHGSIDTIFEHNKTLWNCVQVIRLFYV